MACLLFYLCSAKQNQSVTGSVHNLVSEIYTSYHELISCPQTILLPIKKHAIHTTKRVILTVSCPEQRVAFRCLSISAEDMRILVL